MKVNQQVIQKSREDDEKKKRKKRKEEKGGGVVEIKGLGLTQHPGHLLWTPGDWITTPFPTSAIVGPLLLTTDHSYSCLLLLLLLLLLLSTAAELYSMCTSGLRHRAKQESHDNYSRVVPAYAVRSPRLFLQGPVSPGFGIITLLNVFPQNLGSLRGLEGVFRILPVIRGATEYTGTGPVTMAISLEYPS